jgi:hypothetical protein
MRHFGAIGSHVIGLKIPRSFKDRSLVFNQIRTKRKRNAVVMKGKMEFMRVRIVCKICMLF